MTAKLSRRFDSATWAYFSMLAPHNFPTWLEPYLDAPALLRLKGVSNFCGADFTSFWQHSGYADVYRHSIGCALIVWQHTADPVQTLAALFHDIASPAFKHCVDIMNGDAITCESTEDDTEKILARSPEIADLLRRDHIDLAEVFDYHIYPIADNDSPRLAADRLEYTLSDAHIGMYLPPVPFAEIAKIYSHIEVLDNEDGLPELGFRTQLAADRFVSMAAQNLWPYFPDNYNKMIGKFIADALKRALDNGELHPVDLYKYSEAELAHRLETSKDPALASAFRQFRSATQIIESDTDPQNPDWYTIHYRLKNRWIDPLVRTDRGAARLSTLSESAAALIDRQAHFTTKPFASLPFNF